MQNRKIRLGIVGATGYVGMELCRLALGHPNFELTALCSRSYAGQTFSSIYPAFRGILDLTLTEATPDDLAEKCDVVITALPHGVSAKIVPQLLETGLMVLDHSGDFRFHNVDIYEKTYKLTHPHPELLKQAVYGLPEWHREALKDAPLIANPGCYPTCTVMALAPLAAADLIDTSVPCIVNAVSGTSGAGRKSDPTYNLAEMGGNFKPYGVVGHRHTPEMTEQLRELTDQRIPLTFTPHLLPIGRGMLATIYVKPNDAGRQRCADGSLPALFKETYETEPFVRVLNEGDVPSIAAVAGTNFCDLAVTYDPSVDLIKLFSAIDNLGKGACAQAIQALNVRLGLPETAGLEHIALGL